MECELEEIEQSKQAGRVRAHFQSIKNIRKGYQPRTTMVKSDSGVVLTQPQEVVERGC